jgi:dienelactone hydrolase
MALRFLPLLILTTFCAAQIPASADRARQALDLLMEGNYAGLVERFTPEMQQNLNEEVLRTKVGPALKAMGAVQEIGAPQVSPVGDNTLYAFPARLANMSLVVNVTLDKEGKVAGLLMQPAGGMRPPGATPRAQPPYVKPEAFTAAEVSFGLDDWKLPGTLTMPKGEGPFPAVLLVHGSGPQDRNEAVGGTQVFRDLAEGLSSSGIAVLRYDKRTRVHAARLGSLARFTVREETVDDAVAAVDFLSSHDGIDPKRIYVAGHSLGGYLAPMIAARQKKLAGIVALAANTRPLEYLVVEQVEYLVPMQVADKEKAAAQIEAIRSQVSELKKLDKGSESKLQVLGMPAHYLLDLRGYEPASEARKLGIRILVLQGERDYQVTMEDFAGWRKALDGHRPATLRSYPALNHLFVEGQGKSTPFEYQRAANVSAEVVGDVAAWIATPSAR